MKRSLLLGVGGTGVVLSAAMMWTQPWDTTDQWTTYTDTEKRYSIEYPSSWQDDGQSSYPGTIPGSSALSIHRFSTASDENAAFPDASISVAVFTIDESRSLESIAANDEDHVDGATVSAYTPFQINGAEAIRYTIDARNTASEGAMILDALIRRDNTIYEFEGITDPDRYNDALPLFTHSLQSIMFLP